MAPACTEYVNFRHCCRLCLADGIPMANIFSSRSRSHDLIEKIYSVIGIKVTAQDRVTTNLCERCFMYVNKFDSIKNVCLINQVKLAEALSVFEHSLINESIQIKDEPQSDDDDVIYTGSYIDQPLSVKTESLNGTNGHDDDKPPILSPHLPTADMLRNLELPMIELNEEVVHVEQAEQAEQQQPELDAESLSPLEQSLVADADAIETYETIETEPAQESAAQEQEAPEAVVAVVAAADARRDLAEAPRGGAPDSREKIEFAAGLQLAQKVVAINMEPFTRTEIQYHKRMRLIYTQDKRNVCACHNVARSRRRTWNHVRRFEAVALPPYTCLHCCSTFTRGTYARHSCARQRYSNMYHVSNEVERGAHKHRNYQAFKCRICMCTMRVFDLYVAHAEEHIARAPPDFRCVCERQFSTAAAFREHLMSACVLKHTCDMCDAMFDSAEAFRRHCAEVHDDTDGEAFIIHDDFELLELPFTAQYACVECNVKCVQELFLVEHLKLAHGYAEEDAARRARNDCNIGAESNKAAAAPATDGGGRVGARVAGDGAARSAEADGKADKEGEPELDLLIPIASLRRSKTPTALQMSRNEEFMQTSYKHLADSQQFECQVCFKLFSNVANVRRHVWLGHLGANAMSRRTSSFRCGSCNTCFATMVDLQAHLTAAHLNVCRDCGRQCASAAALDQHRASHLKISLTRDPTTRVYARRASGAEMPLLPAEDALDMKLLTMRCAACDRLFATSRGLNQHVARTHTARTQRDLLRTFPHACRRQGCGVLLKSLPDWMLHMQLHQEGDAASGSSTSNSPSRSDDSDYFTCAKCFKVFVNKGNLTQHMRTHGVQPGAKARRRSCSASGHANDAPTELAKHAQPHAAAAAAKKAACLCCTRCGAAFFDEQTLRTHMSEEHARAGADRNGSKLFECHMCHRRMRSQHGLNGHLAWHRQFSLPQSPPTNSANIINDKVSIDVSKMYKKKTFVCINCAALFPSKAALASHQAAAHGRMRCPTCWQFFSNNAKLSEHMSSAHVKQEPGESRPRSAVPRARSQPRPASCPPPTKRKKALRSCKLCVREFCSVQQFREHMLSNHPGAEVPASEAYAEMCLLCNAPLSNLAGLSSHMRMHQRRGEVDASMGPMRGIPKAKRKRWS